jgi:hypothetical protein
MKNRGFISLILVVLISFSIWTILYSLTEKNEFLFLSIKQNRKMESARSAAYECKIRAFELLTEDIHSNISGRVYSSCSIDSDVQTICTFDICNSNEYGEVRDVHITGRDLDSDYIFKLKTRFIFLNQSPFEIKIVSTERI